MLFLLGLVTGLLIPQLHDPHMGVSAHLEGLLNGIFLAVLGLGWEELRLGEQDSARSRSEVPGPLQG